jgi:hypothetical protein
MAFSRFLMSAITVVLRAVTWTFCTAASRKAPRMPMITITTINSISEKPARARRPLTPLASTGGQAASGTG